MRDELEQVLAGKADASGREHGEQCAECRDEIAAMREQAEWLRGLRAPDDAEAPEPKPGFYARVMERIEAQGPVSIWSLFFDSQLGRGLAVASMVLALSLGAYLVSSEQAADRELIVVGDPGPQPDVAFTASPDRDAVLVNLVTYREQ